MNRGLPIALATLLLLTACQGIPGVSPAGLQGGAEGVLDVGFAGGSLEFEPSP